MLYIYCKIDGFDIIKNSRLRLSRIDRLNDPFELAIGIDDVNAPQDLRNEYKEYPNIIKEWSTILNKNDIIHDRMSDDDILKKFTKFKIEDFRKLSKERLEYWKKNMGYIN